MTISEWAENEVNIVKQEAMKDNEESSYYIACVESALKTFKFMCEEGHSGMSIKVTQDILNDLIDGIPLTPIEDTPDIWQLTPKLADSDVKVYQCKRKFSLFKYVYSDGSISYSDVDRVILKDIDHDTTFYNGSVTRLIDSMYPITMPYIPTRKPFKVYTHDFLVDPKNGDYDTRGILWMVTPYGERVDINRYFKDGGNGMIEIDKAEYEEREKEAMKNAK